VIKTPEIFPVNSVINPFEKDEKKRLIFNLKYLNAEAQKWYVSSVEEKKDHYQVQEFDKSMKAEVACHNYK